LALPVRSDLTGRKQAVMPGKGGAGKAQNIRAVRMRQYAQILVAIFVWLSSSAVVAQSAMEMAARDVIGRQLEAMNRGDGVAAFAFASPAIQAIFGDAANFMRMVERGYPQIYRSRRHRFLQFDSSGGELIQRVLIESDSGTVVARYEMVEIDGTWRINGCTIEQTEGA
jgi:Domain of unknown function (DUF4864)